MRSAAVTVTSTDGRVALRNDSANPVTLSLDVAGWYGATTDDTGDRFVPRAPLTVLDTATKLGLPSSLVADLPTTLALTSAAVPAGTTGVVLSVQTRGRSGSGALTVTRSRATATGRSADVFSAIWTTDLVVVPIGTDHTLTFTSLGAGADVRATVVGYLR